ncbi:DUF6089 family protein [Membranihabitans marinus]
MVFSLTLGKAQKGFEAGAWLGASFYFGDLNPNYDLTHPGVGGGGIVRYNFNDRINLKFGINYIHVHGDDNYFDNSFQQNRGLNFKSNVLDITSELEFNFFSFEPGSQDHYYTPFLSAGFGIFKFNPKATYDGETMELRYLGTEGQNLDDEYYDTKLSGALSGGFKYAINSRWILQFIVSTRFLTTDYLDDVSTTYPDVLVVQSMRNIDNIAKFIDPTDTSYPGKQRGDSVGMDSYSYFGIGLTYYFGGLQCPDISR